MIYVGMRKFLIGCVALGAVGAGIYRWQGSDSRAASGHDASLVKDRVWLDHIPRSETDTVQVFVMLGQRTRQGTVGAFEAASAWQGAFEIFRYELHGSELRVVFPQRGDRETLRVEATRCNERGMDYCLEIEGSSRGVRRYYSRKGWEIRELGDVTKLTAALAP